MNKLESIYMDMMDKGIQYEYLFTFVDCDDLQEKMYDYHDEIGKIVTDLDVNAAYVTGECKFDWHNTNGYESLVVDGNRAYLKLNAKTAIDRIANGFVRDQDSGLWLILIDDDAAIDLTTGTMGEYRNSKYTPKYVLTNECYGLLAEAIENKMYGKKDNVRFVRVFNGIASPIAKTMTKLIKSERQKKAANDGRVVEAKIPSVFYGEITKQMTIEYKISLNHWAIKNDKEKAQKAISSFSLQELSEDSHVSAETIRNYKKSKDLVKLNGAAWEKVHRIALAYDRLSSKS